MARRGTSPWLPVPLILVRAVRKVGTSLPGAMVRRGIAENA